LISDNRGKSCGSSFVIKSTPHIAKNNPIAPPASASIVLSVRSCRITRHREAPSAARMAISFCREAAFASSKFATFAHAISNTKLTAPNKSINIDPVSPTRWLCNETTRLNRRLLVAGYC
jgi:hypothetical protein